MRWLNNFIQRGQIAHARHRSTAHPRTLPSAEARQATLKVRVN
jgi:hypothetical protein